MKRNDKGVIKWVSTRNLYRDDSWYKRKACLKAFGLVAFIGERQQKRRPKRKAAGGRKKASKTVSETNSDETNSETKEL